MLAAWPQCRRPFCFFSPRFPLSPEHYATLEAAGYRLEIDDEKTAAINQPLIPLPGQGPDSIPGFPCYRTVEETYASIWDLEQALEKVKAPAMEAVM